MKILYLMHIPWGWIKQRPHFLALELAKQHDVDVYFRKAITVKSDSLMEKIDENMSIRGVTTIPFEKMPLIKFIPKIDIINEVLIKKAIINIADYDVIWFSSIHFFIYMESLIDASQKVIYDCMDDELEFPSLIKQPRMRNKVKEAEKRLVKRADYTFFSADYLAKKVASRTDGIMKNYLVLNNAIMPAGIEIHNDLPELLKSKKNSISKKFKTLLYVGVIAEWFDFELIMNALDKYNDLQLILIGPNHVNIPLHDRIQHLGTIERRFIFNFMNIADCLIMPFKITELIKSVNPVKLYEYISMNKPVIAPKYSESEKFDDYVYLYDNEADFFKLSQDISRNKLMPKASPKKNKEFIALNTWECRGKSIDEILATL